MNSDSLYSIVEMMARTSQPTLKRGILRKFDCVTLRRCLKYTYDPFLTYGVKKIKVKGYGLKQFNEWTWRLFDVLAKRKLTGNRARQTIQTYSHSLTPKSADLFYRVLTKDLRCGISAQTIHAVFPGLIPDYRVMKAQPYMEQRCSWPMYVSPKIDGLRATFDKGEFYSLSGHIYNGLYHIAKQLFLLDIPVDGELLIPNLSFDKSSGKIRSNFDTPGAEFWVFDLPSIKDTFTNRFFILTELVRDLKNVKIIRHSLVHSHQEVMDYYHQCRTMGFEGVMVKTPDHYYQKKRSYDWMKIKPVETEDVKCVRLFEGQGKYQSQMGGIIVRRGGKNIRVGSGFNDNQRLLFFSNPDRIVGRTCEVQFTEETTGRSLRHPRFIRIRYDK